MAISKYDKKFEYGKILTEGDLNGMVDAINLSIDGVNNADAKSETAIKEATTAKNAVKTLEGLANSTEAMEILAGQVVQIEENKKDILYLKGADQKEIADTITWTNGLWNYTNDKGGGSGAEKQSYRYSNKIDISDYDSVILSGLFRPAHLSTATDRKATVVFYGDGVKLGWKDCETQGSIINIYRADYAQYNTLEIVVNGFQSEETYVPSVKVSKERKVVYQEELEEVKEDIQEKTERIEKNESDIVRLTGEITGYADKEIAGELEWNTGYWNTSGGIVDNDANATYNRRTTLDVTSIDKVIYSNLMPSNQQTTSNRAINVVADGVIVKNISAPSGEIVCSDYQFNESLVLQLSARTDSLGSVSVKTTAEPKFADKEYIKEVEGKIKTNEEGIDKLTGIVVGFDQKEIADTITWTNGLWNYTNDKGGGSGAEKQSYRYSNKIDISDYDSVILSGLFRPAHLSTATDRKATVVFYGDGVKLGWKDCETHGSIINIYRADYAQYNTLEIVVNGFQSEETYVPSVKVSKKGLVDGGDGSIAKRIVLCGDSLIGNDSSLIHYEFKQIAKSQGYEIVRNSMGGENIIGNLTRNGGIAMRTTTEFTIPSSGSAVVELGSAWMKSTGEYAALPSSITSVSVVINNIEGVITRNTDGTYTFARKEEGEAIKVGAGVIFWDKTLWTCRDYPHVWFTGQNGGYENEADWADMINSAARNFGENFIVCSTALERTTNELVRQATKTFGDKYINLRAYTQGQAVYDGQRYGLIDSSYTAADYEALFWPGSDKVHQNNLLSYIWAVLMWNTLLDLGYVEGERIDTGEYYLE